MRTSPALSEVLVAPPAIALRQRCRDAHTFPRFLVLYAGPDHLSPPLLAPDRPASRRWHLDLILLLRPSARADTVPLISMSLFDQVEVERCSG